MKEVVYEAEGDLAAGRYFLLPAHLEVVVLGAGLHHHHGTGYHTGKANPITPYEQFCRLDLKLEDLYLILDIVASRPLTGSLPGLQQYVCL